MADVVFIAVVIAFMALAWLLVRACDRLLGPDDPGLLPGPPGAEPAPLYQPEAPSTPAPQEVRS